MGAEGDAEQRVALEQRRRRRVLAGALDDVAAAVEERAVGVGVVGVGVEKARGVVRDGDRRPLVTVDCGDLAGRALDEQDGAVVGERRGANGGEAGTVERRPDATARPAELRVELVVDDGRRVEDDGDGGRPAAVDVVADGAGGSRTNASTRSTSRTSRAWCWSRAACSAAVTAATFRSGSVGSTTTSGSSNSAVPWSAGSYRTGGRQPLAAATSPENPPCSRTSSSVR